MNLTRPIIFWIAMLAALIAVVTLLRDVLLPFVAGMVLAYLLNPLASRMERLGMNRLLATLAIVLIAVVAIAVVMILTLPVIVRELAYFIENFPLYLRRLHALATDPGHPWLSKLIGEGLGEAERFPAFDLDGRTRPDLHPFARRRDPDRCLLSALRLEPDDCGD
jgi:predicted PurR-regulated permease PerM